MAAAHWVLVLLSQLCLAVTLVAAFESATSAGPSTSRDPRGRLLRHKRTPVKQAAAPESPCSGIVCPHKSRCQSLQGAPICVCPRRFTRLVPSRKKNTTYVCTSARRLPHSEYLDLHHAARAAVGAPPLTWTASLASRAASWAAYLQQQQGSNKACAARIGNSTGYGQNVIASVAETRQPGGAAVRVWIANGDIYSLAKFDPATSSGCSTGNWQNCAPYLTLIWQYSTQIGCATALCPPTQVWVCYYNPPPLLRGLYPYSPCARASCQAPSACDPYRGLPGTCNASPCSQVTCPTNSACALSDDSVPYCTCQAGFSFVNGSCSLTSALATLPQTSIILFPKASFKGSAFLLRPATPAVGKISCVDLPTAVVGVGVKSIKILWWAGDAPASVSSNTQKRCQGVVFWSSPGCSGSSITFNTVPGFPTSWEAQAQALTQSVKSVQCG